VPGKTIRRDCCASSYQFWFSTICHPRHVCFNLTYSSREFTWE